MAGPTDQKIQKTSQPNLFSDISGGLQLWQQLFGGKGAETTVSKTGGSFTDTQQTQMSPDAINYLMKSLMERTSGLAGIAGGQKTPGMYNSTTRNLLLNDLMSRSAGEVAVASAPKVTTRVAQPDTQKTSTKQEGMISPAAGLIGAAGLLAGSSWGKKKIGEGMDWLSDSITGASATPDLAMSPDTLDELIGGGWTTGGSDVAALGMDQAGALSDSAAYNIPYLSMGMNLAQGNLPGAMLAGISSVIPGAGLFAGDLEDPGSGFGGRLTDSIFGAVDEVLNTNVADATSSYFEEGSALDTAGDFIDDTVGGIIDWFESWF